MNELDKFVQISKYAGERFDLIQAGGGNSSVKNFRFKNANQGFRMYFKFYR